MVQITEYQWQQIKNYLSKEPANLGIISEIERQIQTPHNSAIAPYDCDSCINASNCGTYRNGIRVLNCGFAQRAT